MGVAASRLSLAATGQSDAIEGDICITASEAMAVFRLPPIIEKLRQVEPGINIGLIASNSTSDLKRREADIAIRSFRLTQPDLIAKKVADFSAYLYASPSYLDRLGNPVSPEGLNQADFIGITSNDQLMQGLNDRGLSLTARNFPVLTENHILHWELVKQGVGIGIMTAEVGDAEPLVKRVFDFLAAELC